jgi:hypothetical protein
MLPFRTQIKFFLVDADKVDQSKFMPVFQRWIQEKLLEGQLIDVADYRHVFEGPGTVLIGHESDFAIENRDGHLGLLYTRKRQRDADFGAQVRNSLRLTLAAAHLLEAEPVFRPKLKFRADEFEIRFADRLQLPNSVEAFDSIKDELTAILTELYGTSDITVAPVTQDQRYLLTLKVSAPGVTGIDALRQPQAIPVE